jgi:hypothetical protein
VPRLYRNIALPVLLACAISAAVLSFFPAGSRATILCNYSEVTVITAPTVSGTVAAGSTVSTTNGSWTSCGLPLTGYTYRWLRDGLIISGATSSTYVVQPQDVGHVLASTLAGCNAEACADPPAESSNAVGSPAILADTSDHFTFANHDGKFTIYKGCYGPTAHGGQNLTVGPGYIAQVDRINGDGTVTTILNDVRAAGVYTYGGLAQFGFHASRKETTFFENGPYVDTWWENGRRCANDDWNGAPYVSGVGVDSSTIWQAPVVSASVLYFGIDVNFRDPRLAAGSSLLTTRYRYQVTDSRIQIWATVTEHSPYGAGSTAYIKEPKLEFKIGTGVTTGGYKRMSVVDQNGTVLQNSVNVGTTPTCAFFKHGPGTGQCDADSRYRARFDFGTSETTSAPANCPLQPTDTCLNIVGRAVSLPDNPGSAQFNWENGTYGMDGWEHRTWLAIPTLGGGTGALQFNSQDGPIAGTNTCHLDVPATAEAYNRRWEMWSDDGLPNGSPYVRAGIFLKGWDGGAGDPDCEPLAWHDNYPEHAWGNYVSLSFGPGY